jgi:hypothetical protein
MSAISILVKNEMILKMTRTPLGLTWTISKVWMKSLEFIRLGPSIPANCSVRLLSDSLIMLIVGHEGHILMFFLKSIMSE